MRRWAARFASLGLGALLALAFPAPSWWWLAWFVPAPIFLLFARSPSRREALIRGWLAGGGFLAALLYWLVPHLTVFMVPVAAFAGLFWLPIGWVVWAMLQEGKPSTRRLASALVVVPSVWVTVEAVRSWEYLGGGYGRLGASQWQVEPVLQVAAVGGVWLLSFILVAANLGMMAALLPWLEGSQRLAALGVTAALAILAVGYGVTRPPPTDTGSVTVAGVQPGVIDSDRERLTAHFELTRQLEGMDYDFVVWGQSSVAFDPARNSEVEQVLRDAARVAGTDVFVNVDAADEGGTITKSFRQYTPDGSVRKYDKQRLVPFGEYIPLRPIFGWVAEFTEAAQQDRARGQQVSTLTSDGVEIGPLISYESIFPDMRRTLALRDADITIVQGGTWTFQGTWAQPQQASLEAVRAVESGRPAVLVAVSGTSAAFDARGKLLSWLPPDWQGAFLVEVPLSQEDTLHVRWGDWVVWLSGLVTVVTAASAVKGSICVRGIRHGQPTRSGIDAVAKDQRRPC